MMRIQWQWTVALSALFAFLLDQISKTVFISSQGRMLINEGVSFGWRPAGEWLPIGLVVLIFFVAAASFRYWSRAPLATGLFLGGVLANLTDRLIFGGVRDWLPIPLIGLYNNLADWAIAAATILLLYAVIRNEKKL
ncbi:signal peptidase II [Candidatus Woesebacteria bacterium]|nr:signal peptidase II [Candidatus Woesebacteria bacterium]